MANTLNQQRRALLTKTISASTLALVAASGLLLPQRLLAHWPTAAFTAQTVEDALLALVGQAQVATDNVLNFKVGAPPSYAVNGSSVPIAVASDLVNIEHLAILVANNPFPLAMSVDFTAESVLPFKTMIKIKQDSQVIAVIRAAGKLYKTERFVEVDIGGCG